MAFNTNSGANSRIDLHIHSSASDGSLSPREIISLARELHIRAIAITDHDTVQGAKEAIEYGIPPDIDFVTGVEISAALPAFCNASGSLHILAYFIKLDNPLLANALSALQIARNNRIPQILKKLEEIGINISFEEISKIIGKSQPGRPHVAKALLKKGIVKNIQEAFDKYLSKDRPAYVEKYRVDPEKAIEIILNAGGMAVLAHPFLINTQTFQELEELIVYLKSKGLEGIEVFYPEHTPEFTASYQKLAARHGLLITGGTDFHGSVRPEIQIGIGNGNLHVPYELYQKMAEKIATRKHY